MTTRIGILFAGCILVAACAGGSHSVPLVPNAPAQAAKGNAVAALVIHWTSTTPTSSARRPRAISPSAASVVSSVNGTVVNVTNRSDFSQSTIDLDAPIGTDSFTFKVYDQDDGAGKLLGQSMVTEAIVAGQLNTISATVEAVCAQTVVTPVTTHEFVKYAYAPVVAGQVAPPSIASAEILGAGAGELFVAAADADGNIILAQGGTATLTQNPLIENLNADSNHITFYGFPSGRNVTGNVVVSAPGCPPATFTGSTSSAFYAVQTNGSVEVLDRYGAVFATNASPPGQLVGTNGGSPVFYDPATGNVSWTQPDFSPGGVILQARTGATQIAYDAANHALISVVPGATSTVNADYATGPSKQVTVPLNVTEVSASPGGYFVGDGSSIAKINPATFTAGTPVIAAYPYGFLAPYGGFYVVAMNNAAPYLTFYADSPFPSAPGSFSESFTAPLTRGFVLDLEDIGFVGITSAGYAQHVINTGPLLPAGSSLTGVGPINSIFVSYPAQPFF